jgi:hypothetical protein
VQFVRFFVMLIVVFVRFIVFLMARKPLIPRIVIQFIRSICHDTR